MGYKIPKSGSKTYSGAYHMTSDPAKYEPQRNNNFEVVISFNSNCRLIDPDTGNELPKSSASEYIRLSTSTFSAPQANLGVISVPYQNNTIKYAGKPEFPESSIAFNDFIGIDVEKILSAWFALAYNLEEETIGSAADYKQTATLYEYSPNGNVVRSWILEGVWLSSYNLGEFDQEGGSVRKVTGTLQYDRFRRGKKTTK